MLTLDLDITLVGYPEMTPADREQRTARFRSWLLQELGTPDKVAQAHQEWYDACLATDEVTPRLRSIRFLQPIDRWELAVHSATEIALRGLDQERGYFDIAQT